KLGGDIIEVALLKHLTTLEDDAEPLRLLEKNRLRIYTAQSGLIPQQNAGAARPMFSSAQESYSMQAGQPLDVVLRFNDADGVVVNKTFHFKPGAHAIGVNYRIDNKGESDWQATFYAQISRDNSEDPGTESAGFGMQSYLGTATTTEDSPYEKIPFKDIQKKDYRYTHIDGWVAMIQHYFVSAWVPPRGEQFNYFTRYARNDLNVIGLYGNPLVVPPGGSVETGALFYAGPKNQYRLAEIAKHLDLTVDYGWLWMLAQPLYALLHLFATGDLHAFGKVFHVFGGFNNWGVAIIMLTVVVKLVFFRLSASSYRSMANMRRVQPKLLALRDRHKNDKQAQSKAMMELYQKEKINPLGGCLPILIQMPVFIALYWALMESVELRHAPFALWINDLSVMDPYFILPLIMGATMWFQQRMNPAPPDPMQAKVMAWMPVIFTFFFLWFPAGLVIYWVSNNILSIAQQWVITRQIEQQAADKPA
ncbi:MAG: membrane protein insertase YidC, partial [Pseudomonadales bacterium]